MYATDRQTSDSIIAECPLGGGIKSAQRDANANTARWLSKAEPNILAPPQTPFSRAQDGQNLISWGWSLYLYLYL